MAPTETSQPSSFCLADISVGDSFIYLNDGRTVCGCIEGIDTHDDGSVHVVRARSGTKVCVIKTGAPKIHCGETIVVPIGERELFSFTPSYRLPA